MRDLLQESSSRVDTILERFGNFPATTGARADGEELVRIVSTLYGEGMRRVVAELRSALGEERADRILEACCEDPLVASLFVTHGLHPVPLPERVERAIASVPGEIELVSADEDLVEIRVSGSSELAETAERAILAAAPEVLEVRAAGQTISLLELR